MNIMSLQRTSILILIVASIVLISQIPVFAAGDMCADGYASSMFDAYESIDTLEISPPDQFVYASIDGAVEPQNFMELKAGVRSIIGQRLGAGTLVAYARFFKRTDYQPDLSSGPPTKDTIETNKTVLASAPVAVDELYDADPTEFTFDFSANPIPAGIADLDLHVVYFGKPENGDYFVVLRGKSDLYEPAHVAIVNATDRFYLD
jgi:hypothetical protein